MPLPGLYTAGWIKRGPDGLIGTNRGDAFATVEALLADAREGKLPRPPSEPAALLELLASRGVRTVSYADWQRIYREFCGDRCPLSQWITRDELESLPSIRDFFLELGSARGLESPLFNALGSFGF